MLVQALVRLHGKICRVSFPFAGGFLAPGSRDVSFRRGLIAFLGALVAF
jgi:hypothetical protein